MNRARQLQGSRMQQQVRRRELFETVRDWRAGNGELRVTFRPAIYPGELIVTTFKPQEGGSKER